VQVTLRNLTKRFGEATAVDNLSVTFPSGKLTAILGPSGCGKTTTLNVIAGIVPVTSGQVLFNERDVTHLPPEKRGIGLVFQNYALYPHMTVLQNICFPMDMKKIPKKERLARAAELAELVHIAPLMKRKPAELSGGQQQRVAIARALAKDPEVLLLDEPLSNLDAKLRVEMREEIRRIQRESQITTVFVTHDQEEASSIADEIILLKDGVLQQQASPRELYDNPGNLFAAQFIGTPTINQLRGEMRGGKVVLEGCEMPITLPLEGPLPEGHPVILAVRPESVLVQPNEAQLEITVLERYSLGKDELIRVQVGRAQEMRAYVPGELPIRVGETLPIAFKNRGVFLFDGATGARYL